MKTPFSKNNRLVIYGLVVAAAFVMPYPFNMIQAIIGAVMFGICIGYRIER